MAVDLSSYGGLEPEHKARILKMSDISLETITKRYTLGAELGRGRFSVVKSATQKSDGGTYAVKVVENSSLSDEENLEALETEVAILRQLQHPHIVALKEVVTTDSDTYIVMELLSGGELFNRIVDLGPFVEATAADMFAQVCCAMEHLHSAQIVHRDIKPENILYTEEGGTSVKVIDFGYAGVWSPEKPLTGLCGTPDYVAPEVLTWYDDEDRGKEYGKGSDVWSMGVLLYVILSGCSPFSADEEEALLAQVAEAKYEFYENEWKSVSEDAKDLIRKMLVVDPEVRLSLEGVMSHPFLAEAVGRCRANLDDAAAAAADAKAEPPKAEALAATPKSGGRAAQDAAADITLQPAEDDCAVQQVKPGSCCVIS